MSNFRNQHVFFNWIGVAPGNNESAGKRKSGKTTYGNKTLKATLTQCGFQHNTAVLQATEAKIVLRWLLLIQSQ